MSKQKRKPRDKFKPIVDGNKPALKGTGLSVGAFIIRGGKTKHRPGRKFGKGEFVQAALLAIFLDDPSKQNDIGVGHRKALVKEVNDRLAVDPDYLTKYPKGAKVHSMTVKRALDKLAEANP